MQLKDVAPSYTIATIIAIAVYFLKYLPLSYWIILPLQLAVGTVVFLTICEIKKIDEYIEIKQMVVPSIQKVKCFIKKKK